MVLMMSSGFRVGTVVNINDLGECVVLRDHIAHGPRGEVTVRFTATREIRRLALTDPLKCEVIGGPKTDEDECVEIVKLESGDVPSGVSFEKWRAVLLAALEGELFRPSPLYEVTVDGSKRVPNSERVGPHMLQSVIDVARNALEVANR
jgi:hypothetical protein